MIKICDIEHDIDAPPGWCSLWRCGSGLSLGLSLRVGSEMIDLPMVELRKVLMDELLWDVVMKLHEMDGHEIMAILIDAMREH